MSTSTYEGDRYKLTYSSLWSKATYKTVDGSGVKGLSYDDGKGELIMNATTELGASIATESDRKELMNSFRNMYDSHSEYEIYASYDMKILKDDIYYGRLDTKVNGYKRGSFIILASESKDILISFMTNTEMDVDEFANITLKLLKTIEID